MGSSSVTATLAPCRSNLVVRSARCVSDRLERCRTPDARSNRPTSSIPSTAAFDSARSVSRATNTSMRATAAPTWPSSCIRTSTTPPGGTSAWTSRTPALSRRISPSPASSKAMFASGMCSRLEAPSSRSRNRGCRASRSPLATDASSSPSRRRKPASSDTSFGYLPKATSLPATRCALPVASHTASPWRRPVALQTSIATTSKVHVACWPWIRSGPQCGASSTPVLQPPTVWDSISNASTSRRTCLRPDRTRPGTVRLCQDQIHGTSSTTSARAICRCSRSSAWWPRTTPSRSRTARRAAATTENPVVEWVLTGPVRTHTTITTTSTDHGQDDSRLGSRNP